MSQQEDYRGTYSLKPYKEPMNDQPKLSEIMKSMHFQSDGSPLPPTAPLTDVMDPNRAKENIPLAPEEILSHEKLQINLPRTTKILTGTVILTTIIGAFGVLLAVCSVVVVGLAHLFMKLGLCHP